MMIFTLFNALSEKFSPFKKQKSDLDVPLDEELIRDDVLFKSLKKIFNLELILIVILFFFKQVLIHSSDRYGKLTYH